MSAIALLHALHPCRRSSYPRHLAETAVAGPCTCVDRAKEPGWEDFKDEEDGQRAAVRLRAYQNTGASVSSVGVTGAGHAYLSFEWVAP
jgi:hypothetical protein